MFQCHMWDGTGSYIQWLARDERASERLQVTKHNKKDKFK